LVRKAEAWFTENVSEDTEDDDYDAEAYLFIVFVLAVFVVMIILLFPNVIFSSYPRPYCVMEKLVLMRFG
jgi:hypothetical protein